MKHNNFISITLKDISPHFLSYIHTHLQVHQDAKDTTKTIRKAAIRFISSIASYFHLMVLSNLEILKRLKRKDEMLAFEAIHRDLSYLLEIWSSRAFHSSLNPREIYLLMLQCCLQAILKYDFGKLFAEYLFGGTAKHPILIQLIQLAVTVEAQIKSVEITSTERISLNEEIRLEESEDGTYYEEEEKPFELDYESFYKSIFEFEQNFAVLTHFYQTVRTEDDFVTFIDNNMKKQIIEETMPFSLLNIFNFSVILVTRMQEYKQNKDYGTEVRMLPGWLVGLTQCIKSNEPHICNSSIEGLIFIISEKRTKYIYSVLKKMLQEHASKFERDFDG